MMRRVIWTLILAIFCSATAFADDLYRVEIRNELDARRLAATGADPVVRLLDGYLVLADDRIRPALEESNLTYSFVAADVERDQLALDRRRDSENLEKYSMLFEQGDIRLLRVDPGELSALAEPGDLMPLGDRLPKIDFQVSRPIDYAAAEEMVDLEWLISQIDRDSLESYVNRLQYFYRRVAGTPGNNFPGQWIASKLADFGYDSVVIDSFAATVDGKSGVCWNVLAYKIGGRFPNHHVIVGAHRDAVPDSPGANDNGSGTAGVLEIARVLQDIETDMTIVFALFDAEELGLLGAWHYADEANARGDSIVYMLNMDMIAHYENDSLATLYHGSDITYTQLWQILADSLVGITGYRHGNSAGSDHYPFTQYEYPATFVIEDIFSPNWHTPHDSTTYMDFNYMHRIVQASLATAYMVNATAGPRPALAFAYPGGLPVEIPPGAPYTFEIAVSGIRGGTVQPGSGLLHYSTNGVDYDAAALTEISATLLEAVMPPFLCNQEVYYFVSVKESEGVTYYDPGLAGYHVAYVSTGRGVVWTDNFENEQGWEVYSNAAAGDWERGIPQGGGEQGDPPADFDGSGQCFVTGLAAGSNVDGGAVILTSPTLDLSTGSDPVISYARWFSNDTGGDAPTDYFIVRVSNDNGLRWRVVEIVGPVDQASGGWYEHSFAVSDFVTPTSQVKVRFALADYGAESVIEAAVDAFTVSSYLCEGEEDWDNDGVLNIADNCPFAVNPEQENNDNDERGDLCDDDDDNDGVLDGADNCLFAANADQRDADGDGIGDACDECDCTGLGDLDGDGSINPVDVVFIVNYVYKSLDARQPLSTICPVENGDWDCDGDVNPVDVVYYANYVYKSVGTISCSPCGP